jgi:hypothetical protein
VKDILALSAETGNNKLDQIMLCSEIGCVCVGGGGGPRPQYQPVQAEIFMTNGIFNRICGGGRVHFSRTYTSHVFFLHHFCYHACLTL